MKQLILYTRLGCHLCEDMHEALEAVRVRYGFTLKSVDIDTVPALRKDYNDKVPVLAGENGEELCRYFFDEAVLARYLAL